MALYISAHHEFEPLPSFFKSLQNFGGFKILRSSASVLSSDLPDHICRVGGGLEFHHWLLSLSCSTSVGICRWEIAQTRQWKLWGKFAVHGKLCIYCTQSESPVSLLWIQLWAPRMQFLTKQREKLIFLSLLGLPRGCCVMAKLALAWNCCKSVALDTCKSFKKMRWPN